MSVIQLQVVLTPASIPHHILKEGVKSEKDLEIWQVLSTQKWLSKPPFSPQVPQPYLHLKPFTYVHAHYVLPMLTAGLLFIVGSHRAARRLSSPSHHPHKGQIKVILTEPRVWHTAKAQNQEAQTLISKSTVPLLYIALVKQPQVD